MGIRAFADTGNGYFEVTEVQTVISLLQIIDNPRQDIPLLAVLRSPIAFFTPVELMDIRMAEPKETFYEALKAMAASGEGEVSNRSAEFLKRLCEWRDKSLNMSISEFIWYLYMETGYYAYTGAMPGGVQRQANLRILFERARQYEETSFKGLFNFINFINRLKSSSGDMGSAKTLGENENVVRIMSIHKSKGLEFPVVIAAGMGKKFNLMDLNRSILVHHELGLGPEFVDPEKRISYPTVIKQAIKRKIKLESYSEEMRILYVAFTRAREKLIITGAVKDLEKACAKWSSSMGGGRKISEYLILRGNTFLDWICPALLKHSDGRTLREAAGADFVPEEAIMSDGSRWEIKLHNRGAVLSGLKAAASREAEVSEEIIPERKYLEEVRRRLEWRYPYEKSSAIPAKLSVTEIKRMAQADLEDDYTRSIFLPPLVREPVFLGENRGLTPAEKGTVMHLVMQHIDLSREYNPGDIEDLTLRLVEGES
jgi:ATP-dependent helicase/nuclease subunit A